MAGNNTTVTIRDVARHAGVSTATVSRVVNGLASVDPKLAERVKRSVKLTGFVPNSTGRALRRQVSDVWAAIVSDSQNPFFTTLVSGVEQIAAENRLSVMLSNTDEDVTRESQLLSAAVAHRMAGVVIAVASETRSDLSPLLDANVPTVLVDRRIKGYSGDSVLVDNQEAGRLAAEHLIKQGYRRPAIVSGPTQVSTTADRAKGFREALEAMGVHLPRLFIRDGALRVEGAYAAASSLLDLPEPPDAIFATNGPMTAGTFRAINDRGISVPNTIGLIGVDDDMWTRMVSPRVTVIQQPVLTIGKTAAELLLKRREEPGRASTSVVLAPSLLGRESTQRAG